MCPDSKHVWDHSLLTDYKDVVMSFIFAACSCVRYHSRKWHFPTCLPGQPVTTYQVAPSTSSGSAGSTMMPPVSKGAAVAIPSKPMPIPILAKAMPGKAKVAGASVLSLSRCRSIMHTPKFRADNSELRPIAIVCVHSGTRKIQGH